MKEKTYVFFDIDGTLLPEGDTDIPQNTIEAINKLRSNGIKVFICTGRGYHQAKKYIEQISADGYITSNGQEAQFGEEKIYSYNLNKEEIISIKEKLTKHEIPWGFETRKGIFLQNTVEGVDKLKERINGYGIMEVYSGHIDDFEDIKQMWAFGDKETLSCFEQDIIDDFKFFRWSDDSIEVLPLEESKAKALEKVVGQDNVKTYAFGDGYNDMELLTTADLGVAMGNAKLEIKAVADYITDDCDKDGIAKALRNFKLID